MAGRGPLPNPQARYKSPFAIPTTNLPPGGRPGTVPKPPKWVVLGAVGVAWWRWAWKLPHAAGWSEGDLVTVAHRAALEDDLDAVDRIKGLDFIDVMGGDDDDMNRLIRRLSGLATGRVAILKEIRELDTRLGLTPKAMADLRWKIAADKVDEVPVADSASDDLADRRRRLGA